MVILLLLLLLLCILFNIETFTNDENNNVTYYVIHMKGNEKRYNNILMNEKKLNKKINIFDAINGKTLDLNNLSIFHPQLQLTYKYLYVGEVGCYLSHFMLLKSLLDKKEGYTVIFEDDLKILGDDLNKKINNLLNIIDQDFDMLYLGDQTNNFKDNYKEDIYYIDPNNHLWGTHAYIVKNKNIEKIYNTLLNLDVPIDCKYEEQIKNKNINGLIIHPNLVNQSYECNSIIRTINV